MRTCLVCSTAFERYVSPSEIAKRPAAGQLCSRLCRSRYAARFGRQGRAILWDKKESIFLYAQRLEDDAALGAKLAARCDWFVAKPSAEKSLLLCAAALRSLVWQS